MEYVALFELLEVMELLPETLPDMLPLTFQKPKLTFVSREEDVSSFFVLAIFTSILKFTSAESMVNAGSGTKDKSGASIINSVGVTVPLASSTIGRV